MKHGQTVIKQGRTRVHVCRVAGLAALFAVALLLPLPVKAAVAGDAGTPTPTAASDWGTPDLGLLDRVQDWLARANRAFQTTVVRRLSTPTNGGSDDAIARKLNEEKDLERAAAMAAADRKAKDAQQAKEAEDAHRQAVADAKRREDEHKAAATAKDEADAKARLEDEKREAADNIATAQKLIDERKAAEQQRQAEEEQKRRAEDATRQAEAEQAAAEQVKLEAQRAEEKRRADAEAERNKARVVAPIRPPVVPRDLAEAEPQPSPKAERKFANADDVSSRPTRRGRHVWRGPMVKRWFLRAHGQCRYAGKRFRGWYTVRHGDSLWLIAKRYYHTGWGYRRILRANRWLFRHPNLIYPCQRIKVPRRHR